MKPFKLVKPRFAGALLAFAVLMPAAGEAQLLPPPFGRPQITPQLQCTAQYRSLLKLQVEGYKRLQKLARSEGETLCTALESADTLGVDKLIDPKLLQGLLTPQQREFLESLGVDLSKVDLGKLARQLGIDLSQIDLRQFKHQCRQSQGEIDRLATTELGRLENELIRCDDRI